MFFSSNTSKKKFSLDLFLFSMPWFHQTYQNEALYTHQMAPMQSEAPSQPYSENLSGTPGVTRKPLPLSCYIQYCLFLSKDICLPGLLRLDHKKNINIIICPMVVLYSDILSFCILLYVLRELHRQPSKYEWHLLAVETQNAASGLLKKVVFWQHRK